MRRRRHKKNKKESETPQTESLHPFSFDSLSTHLCRFYETEFLKRGMPNSKKSAVALCDFLNEGAAESGISLKHQQRVITFLCHTFFALIEELFQVKDAPIQIKQVSSGFQQFYVNLHQYRSEIAKILVQIPKNYLGRNEDEADYIYRTLTELATQSSSHHIDASSSSSSSVSKRQQLPGNLPPRHPTSVASASSSTATQSSQTLSPSAVFAPSPMAAPEQLPTFTEAQLTEIKGYVDDLLSVGLESWEDLLRLALSQFWATQGDASTVQEYDLDELITYTQQVITAHATTTSSLTIIPAPASSPS